MRARHRHVTVGAYYKRAMRRLRPGELLCNCTRVLGPDGRELNALKWRDFTDAEFEGRRQVREYARFFQDHLVGCERSFVNDTGVQVGVRQTRQMSGVTGAATLLFFHGGYWQRNAKEGFSFVAEGPLAHGFHVAVAGYTLAPEATMDDIVREARSRVGFTSISRRWEAIRGASMSAAGRPAAISPRC